MLAGAGAAWLWRAGNSAGPLAPPECDGEIEVPDAGLRALLLAILADPEAGDSSTGAAGPVLTGEALLRITGLQAADQDIADLRGLEVCA